MGTIPATTGMNGPAVVHRAHFGVECPVCHTRRFLEVQIEEPLQSPELQKIIHDHLVAWMATHCPEHLSAILKWSKN